MAASPFARRTFSLDDQCAFARISGDWNPLHVDPIAARRTMFERPVVHGIHLLLWALDRWLEGGASLLACENVRATFRKPAFLETEIVLEAIEQGDSVRLVATAGPDRVLDATLVWSSAAALAADVPARSWDAAAPTFVARDAIATTRGQVELVLDRSLAQTMFPHVLVRLGPLIAAELLATTRVVGMKCPGLHSIFGGLELARSEHDALELAYEVARANLKYSMVDLAVRSRSLSGTIASFYRPIPQDGPTNDAIRAAVTPSEWHAQRALVVGGSRGIGEALARCLAFGAADVCITYHRGAADAQRVVEASRDAPGRLRAIPLDVTAPVSLEEWPFEAPPTHVYYLATPRIPAVARYSRDAFDLMIRYYVDGLLGVIDVACKQTKSLVIWTPSTSFLSDGGGSPSYTMAKAAMEQLCQRLPQMLPVRVHAPRLPKVATDQTAGLIQVEARPVLEVALTELRALTNRV